MKVKLDTLYLEFVNSALSKKLRSFASAPFVLMLIASFALWYIAKLGYTYTTEIDVKIKIEDQKIWTTCIVEGVGTNLVGYKIYSGGAINIPITEVKYEETTLEGDKTEYITLDETMVSKVISFHYSDIKVISVETPLIVEMSDRIKEKLEKE